MYKIRLCCLVNVEAEVEKKYREKILYKNISGLSKVVLVVVVVVLHGQNCVVNENCLYKAILKSHTNLIPPPWVWKINMSQNAVSRIKLELQSMGTSLA